jgi:thiamine-phosphate pyrophosphorylase
MLVTDRRLLPEDGLPALVAGAARAGVDYVQLREKDLGDRALLELAREVCAAAAGTGARVLVNGRPDVALAAGAHGVQLPADGLPAADVRRAFPDLLVGVSCHSVEAAARAERAGAHLVLLGPVFPTRGKERALGTGPLAAAAAAAGVPVLAIGGITPETAGDALRAGARGVAAIRAFVGAEPQATVRALRGR